mgnify:CR=1 FL=1
MKRELAPVIMFVYNRLDSVEQTIENLKRNELAEQAELFIFSDAAKKALLETISTKLMALRVYIL